MLFVNAEVAAEPKYPNAFLEGGRKLVWFPSFGQTRHHPLIQRMLSAAAAQEQGIDNQVQDALHKRDIAQGGFQCKRDTFGGIKTIL